MRYKLLAQRYAKAVLMNIDAVHFDSFRNDIQVLESSFFEDPEYIKSIDSLLYPLKDRLALANTIAAKLANKELWKNLFDILVKKHRFSIIGEILLALDQAILDQTNTVKVQLSVAHQLDKTVLKDIQNKIKKILKKEVELAINIKPDLIGGFVAQTESMLIDGSIRHNLVKLLNIKKK